VPSARWDVNPTALAAIVAGGLYGIEEGLELEPEFVGNAYDSDKPRLPTTLREAADLFARARRPRRLRCRGRRPLHEHGTSRARRVRLGRHDWERYRGSNACEHRTCGCQPRHRGDNRDHHPDRRGSRRRSDRPLCGRAAGLAGCLTSDRARLLRRFAEAVDGANEELARLEVANSVTRSRTPAGRRATSATCLRTTQEHPSGCAGVRSRCPVAWTSPSVSRSGRGIIVPWNFPMPIASWGFGPALAAGNTVVLKPADLTPLTAIRVGELALEAGIPEHVFQVLPGRGSVVGWRFVTHPVVGKICFTGSTEVGQAIMAGCSEQVKRVTLELGGKSANIIFADSDLEAAAAAAPYAVSTTRARIAARVHASSWRQARTSASWSTSKRRSKRCVSSIPPMKKARWAAHQCRATGDRIRLRARRRPGRLRGSAPEGAGFWYPPTVLVPDSPDSPAVREEIFGQWSRCCGSKTRRMRSVSRTTRHTVSRARSGPATSGVPSGRAGGRDRRDLRELELLCPLLDTVRRLQALRHRARARTRRPRGVHRAEERFHRDRELIVAAPTPAKHLRIGERQCREGSTAR